MLLVVILHYKIRGRPAQARAQSETGPKTVPDPARGMLRSIVDHEGQHGTWSLRSRGLGVCTYLSEMPPFHEIS
jgi:hypothetical protein